MYISRRLLLQIAALAAMSPVALAQSKYPTRPVRIIVPFPPGGAVDVIARPLSQDLSGRLGQQFYVENIGGAGGNLGTGQAARSAPDGHTILMALSSYVVNPALYAKLPYDPHKDFAPITLAVSTPTALVVNPAVPASTVQDLVAFIKENRSKYGFAHGGVGTQGHLTGEQFRMKLGLDLVAVPFGGGGPAIASVLGGHTPIGFIALGAAASSIKSGQLRALAVTGKNRSPLLARVPTMTEAGYPDIVGDNWVGVLAPAGTPKEITSLLHREITESLRDPQIKGVLGELGYEVVATSPKEFAERITSEIDTWGNVIRTANIKMQ